MSRRWTPAEVLPHAGPMLLLTRVVAWTADSLVGEVDVDGDGPLAEPGLGVPRLAAIEYMAQAVGALDGIRLREAGVAVPPGYLLGTRRLDGIDGHFAPGTTLRVTVREILHDANGLGAYACVLEEGERAMSCQLTLYRPPAGEPPRG